MGSVVAGPGLPSLRAFAGRPPSITKGQCGVGARLRGGAAGIGIALPWGGAGGSPGAVRWCVRQPNMRLKLTGVIVLEEAVVLWRLRASSIVQPWMSRRAEVPAA